MRVNSLPSKLIKVVKRPKIVVEYLTCWLCNGYFSALDFLIGDFIESRMFRRHHIYGDPKRVQISKLANVNNALFNVASGEITIEDYAFCAHNVSLITGTHNYCKKGVERQAAIPLGGRDIVVRRGAWIGSNAVILGPCTIGENAVVAANSLVNRDVPPGTIVGGSPAKHLKTIRFSEQS